MSITMEQVRNIGEEFARLEPTAVPESQKTMTAREAVFELAPVIIQMKVRGFSMPEIVSLLAERGISVKPATLGKYLYAFSRQQAEKKGRKRDTHPPPQSKSLPHYFTPDIPDDQL